MSVVAAFLLPTSGGTSSLAFRFLTGDGSSGFTGDEWYATTREPPGVASGALVACGSAGRVVGNARVSRGWSISEDLVDVRSPMAEGVGVKGGGLMGESEDVEAAPLRFFGRGVAGRSGMANSPFSADESGSSCCACACAVADALLFRFFVSAVGFFSTFVYFATLAFTPSFGLTGMLVLATRAERLRDIVMICSGRCSVLTVKEV